MAFPFRQPRVACEAWFSAGDPNRQFQVYDPEAVTKRINSMLRRRLSDRVETLFQATRTAGDLETAADLLEVLVNVQERGRRNFGGERRISDDTVAKAREELATMRPEHRLSP